jgi:hypothetical protein
MPVIEADTTTQEVVRARTYLKVCTQLLAALRGKEEISLQGIRPYLTFPELKVYKLPGANIIKAANGIIGPLLGVQVTVVQDDGAAYYTGFEQILPVADSEVIVLQLFEYTIVGITIDRVIRIYIYTIQVILLIGDSSIVRIFDPDRDIHFRIILSFLFIIHIDDPFEGVHQVAKE